MYRCPKCRKLYETKGVAELCEKSHLNVKYVKCLWNTQHLYSVGDKSQYDIPRYIEVGFDKGVKMMYEISRY